MTHIASPAGADSRLSMNDETSNTSGVQLGDALQLPGGIIGREAASPNFQFIVTEQCRPGAR